MVLESRRTVGVWVRDLALGFAVVALASWGQIRLFSQTTSYVIEDVTGNLTTSPDAQYSPLPGPYAAVPTSVYPLPGGYVGYTDSYHHLEGRFLGVGDNVTVSIVDRLNPVGITDEILESALTTVGTCPDGSGQCTYTVDNYDCSVYARDLESGAVERYAGGGCSNSDPSGQSRLIARFTTASAFGYVEGHGVLYGTCNFSTPAIYSIPASGNVAIVAGTRSFANSDSPDGTPATAAPIKCPYSNIEPAYDTANPSQLDGFLYLDRELHKAKHVNQAGLLRTFAGNGLTNEIPGTGDDGPATSAVLISPSCLRWRRSGSDGAVDTPSVFGDGLYICQQIGRVRYVNQNGIITTVFGRNQSPQVPGQPAVITSAGQPRGLAFDAAGTMYVGDVSNARLNIVKPDGTFQIGLGTPYNTTPTWFYSNGENRPANLAAYGNPSDVEVTRNIDGSIEYVLIADPFDNRVRGLNVATNTVFTFAGDGMPFGDVGENGPAINAFINRPVALLARNLSGTIAIAQQFGSRISEVDENGIITTLVGTGSDNPYNILAVGPALTINIKSPRGLAGDAAGNVYWTELNGNIVRKRSVNGTVSRVAGNGLTTSSGDGGDALQAGIPNPYDVAVTPDGSRLYISHYFGLQAHAIRVVDFTQSPPRISTLAGGGSPGYSGDGGAASAAKLNQPIGLELMGNTLIAAEQGNHVLRRITGLDTATPMIETLAGTGVPGRLGRGGVADTGDAVADLSVPLATTARLFGPSAARALPDGTVYFAEAFGHRVGRLRPYTAPPPPTGPPGPPGTPVASVNGNVVTFTWTAPTTGAPPFTYILLARLTAGGPVVASLDVGASASFTVAAPNGTFIVSIRATNAQGAGPESAPVTFGVPGVPAPPGPPLNLTAAVVVATVNFSWTPPSSGGAPGIYTLLAALSPNGPVIATLPIAAQTDALDGIAAAVTSVSVANVPAGTYYVKLTAQNLGGTSAASNEVAVNVVPPNAPTMNAPSISGHTVALTWTPASSGGVASGYLLTASLTPGGPTIASVPTTPPALTVTNVPSGTYYVRVRATNAVGQSGLSNEVTVVVPWG